MLSGSARARGRIEVDALRQACATSHLRHPLRPRLRAIDDGPLHTLSVSLALGIGKGLLKSDLGAIGRALALVSITFCFVANTRSRHAVSIGPNLHLGGSRRRKCCIFQLSVQSCSETQGAARSGRVRIRCSAATESGTCPDAKTFCQDLLFRHSRECSLQRAKGGLARRRLSQSTWGKVVAGEGLEPPTPGL